MATPQVTQRFIETNGIRMNVAEAGAGPLVVLLHGFPESWHAWRHQFQPLVDAGFHVVAPSLRGYGQTEGPEPLEAYDIFQLTGDIVGLVNALGERSAVVVGHDWGAWIASYLALLRPDLFHALVLVSVPYVPRRQVNQTVWEQQTYPGKIFYQAGLRSPMAETYFQANVRATLLQGLYSLSGQATGDDRFLPARDPGQTPSSNPPVKPSWLTDEDLDLLAAEFQQAGFRGGLNYYRNMDRNWAMTPFLNGAKILQPTLFVAGDRDPVIEFLNPEFVALEQNVQNLTRKVLLPGVGHWTQQEAPEELNQLLIQFLRASG